jgi:hypothetical protein
MRYNYAYDWARVVVLIVFVMVEVILDGYLHARQEIDEMSQLGRVVVVE